MDKILCTQRLILRPLCVGDLVSAYAYSGDPENTRYMRWFDKTPADTERFLREAEVEWRKENPEFFEFAVVWQGSTSEQFRCIWRWLAFPENLGGFCIKVKNRPLLNGLFRLVYCSFSQAD